LGILRLSAKAAKGMYNIIEKEHQRRVEAEKERKIIERNNLQRHNSETLKEVINTINGVQEIMRQIQSTGKGNQNTHTAFVKQSSFEVQRLTSKNASIRNTEEANAVRVEIDHLLQESEKFRRKAHEQHVNLLLMQENDTIKETIKTVILVKHEIEKMKSDPLSMMVDEDIKPLSEGVRRAQALIDAKSYDKSKDITDELKIKIEKTIKIFKQKKSTYLQISVFIDKLKGYISDNVIRFWVGDKMNALQKDCEVLRAEITKDKTYNDKKYISRIQAYDQDSQQLLAEAAEKQENELARGYLVNNFMLPAMKEAKFDAASPKLHGGRDGKVVLIGSRAGLIREQTVTIQIDSDCIIRTEIDGGDSNDVSRIIEAKLDKSKELNVACRKVTQELLDLIRQKGFPLEETNHEWHNPERIAEGERLNPWQEPYDASK